MGDVISLEQRRSARALGGGERGRRQPACAPPAATLWFDLGSPSTYFAAERAERLFPGLAWRPVLAPVQMTGAEASEPVATARAAELRMPLVWPEGATRDGRAAMRVASLAAERGRASAFVLAASRLRFCGGFDLEDPEMLAEAAAAAALGLDDCLEAAGDRDRDLVMTLAGERLMARGADRLPVLEVAGRLFCGEERLGHASAALRDGRLQAHPAAHEAAVPLALRPRS